MWFVPSAGDVGDTESVGVGVALCDGEDCGVADGEGCGVADGEASELADGVLVVEVCGVGEQAARTVRSPIDAVVRIRRVFTTSPSFRRKRARVDGARKF